MHEEQQEKKTESKDLGMILDLLDGKTSPLIKSRSSISSSTGFISEESLPYVHLNSARTSSLDAEDTQNTGNDSASVSSSQESKPSQRSSKISCPICGKIFGYSQHLKSHITTVHLKLRNYHCDICNRPFGEKSAVKKHKKSMHKVDN